MLRVLLLLFNIKHHNKPNECSFEHTLVKLPNKVNPICKPATGLPYLQLGLVLAFLDAFRYATDGSLCRLCVIGA